MVFYHVYPPSYPQNSSQYSYGNNNYTECLLTARGPTPTGIQHKSFRIPIGIWNLGEESEILSEMNQLQIRLFSYISCKTL